MKYLFSIIIPVFNSKKFINEAVNSIVIQKMINTEIILINDCSTDGSGKICKNLNIKYPFLNE